MLHQLTILIHYHPKISGILGSIIAVIFSMIDIPQTTQYLELAGAFIKFLGIVAGASIAIASAWIYFKSLFKKRDQTN